MAEFCVADFGAAIGVSTDAGRTYLGDAVEVRYRLPLLWGQVMSGRVPVWKARRIATHTHSLSAEAAAAVDRHLAPVAHRVSYAQIDRTVEAARSTFDPIEAEHGASTGSVTACSCGPAPTDVPTPDISEDPTPPATADGVVSMLEWPRHARRT